MCAALLLGACKEVDVASSADLSALAWDKINAASVYFGHQSVGFDLLEGMAALKRQYPQFRLPLHPPGAAASGAGIYHRQIGSNGDPHGKLQDFFTVVGERAASGSLVAMKLCYADITRDTDITALFADYSARVAQLQRQNPGLRIVHFTVPLTADATGAKAWLKQRLGKRVRGYQDNVQRTRYNQLVLASYGAAVFDLARFESTLADGRRVAGRIDGQPYYALAASYTTDGGHLNASAQQYIAGEWLRFLSTYLAD